MIEYTEGVVVCVRYLYAAQKVFYKLSSRFKLDDFR